MAPRCLAPLPVPAGPEVLALLPHLRRALHGDGDALLPHDASTPPPELGVGLRLGEGEDDPHDPTAIVVAGSGSSGRPKGSLLPASALLASASATHDRLGGPGRWLLALRAHHVAGLQVLVRSLVSGTTPVAMDLSAGFHPGAFVAAARQLTGARRYTALVPTQLVRLLDAGPDAVAAVASLDAVLVGGAALPRSLADRARAAGVAVVATYGMSETCGGCVYDGVPLDGVTARIDAGGRVLLAGPVLARGYRRTRDGTPDAFSTDARGRRRLRTDDLGSVDGDGRLTVLGRADDVVVTGGLKVAPRPVEEALLAMPGVAEAAVVGAADAQWGQRVVAVLVPDPGGTAPTDTAVREHVAATVAAHAAPHQVLRLDALPLRGPGKPDRAALARIADAQWPQEG